MKKQKQKILLFYLITLGTIFISVSVLIFFLYPNLSQNKIYSSHKVYKNPSITDCVIDTVCKDCNLILLSVDSLRADHLKSYGYNRETAPTFTNLTSSGVLFKNYFTSAYLTPITEMSLHTGMYPSSNGVIDFNSYLPKSTQTLSQIMQSRGYTTSAYITSPEFVNFEAVYDNFKRGFDRYKFYKTYTRSEFGDITGIVSHESSLESELQLLKKDKFFLWIPIGIVHWPYGLGIPNYFANSTYEGFFKDKILNWHEVFSTIYDKKVYTDNTTLNNSDLQYLQDLYDNGIFQFDIFLSELKHVLTEKNLLDNTILIITSEHGEDLHDTKYIAHYDIYDTQIHTPLLIIAPSIKKGIIIEEMASTVDVLPTILSMFGLFPPAQVQGESLVPYICGYINKNNKAVFIERIPLWEEGLLQNELIKKGVFIGEKRNKDSAIRTKEWKYILRSSQPVLNEISWWKLNYNVPIYYPKEELYHISVDNKERTNVIEQNPQVVAHFKQLLLEWENKINLSTPSSVKKSPIIQKYF